MSLERLVKMLEDTFHMDTWQQVDLEEDDLYDTMPMMKAPEEKCFAIFLEHLKKKAQFSGEKLRIFRAMSLKDVGAFVKSLKKNKVGVSWTFDRDLAVAYRREYDGQVYILEGLVDPKEIDEESTVALAVEFSSHQGLEGEIRLAEGATVTIERISPKKGGEPVVVKKEAIAESEADAVKVDPSVTVTPSIETAEEKFKSKGDGLHDDGRRFIVKKQNGKVVGIIEFQEWRDGTRKVEEGEITTESALIDYVWVDPEYRKKGVAKEMLLYAIKKLGIVESNRSVNDGGDALWSSIEDLPGITVFDAEANEDPEDSGEYGYIAYRDDIVADIGSGGSGPNGYKRISEIEFDDNGMPEELEPYMEYPWSPKSKESLPEDEPEAPIVTDYSWPFPGQRLQRLPFRRDEERVNKNPNTKQSFVRRAMETKSGIARGAPDEQQQPVKEGPKAPPKVPGQPDVEVETGPIKKKQASFPEFIAKVKLAFQGMKETFTKPPTWIWNPKEGPESKLDIQSIKDSLKMKFPKLIWYADFQGVETATVDFPDFTYAKLTIGGNAHLTVTYHIEGKGN